MAIFEISGLNVASGNFLTAYNFAAFGATLPEDHLRDLTVTAEHETQTISVDNLGDLEFFVDEGGRVRNAGAEIQFYVFEEVRDDGATVQYSVMRMLRENDSNLLVSVEEVEFNGETVYQLTSEPLAVGEYRITSKFDTDLTVVLDTVVAANAVPVAVDDSATTNEDTSVYIPILDNDTDEDVDALTVELSDPSDGTVQFDGEGYIYTPDADFNGQDSFSYTISDGEFSDSATVTITVNQVNDAPDVAAVSGSALEGDTPIAFNLLEGAVDRDGDDLDLSGTTTVVAQGDCALDIESVDAETGLITFTAGQFEDLGDGDTVVIDVNFGVTDGTATVANTGQFTIIGQNDGPTVNSDAFSIGETGKVSGNLILGSGGAAADSDPDGDLLQVTELRDENGNVLALGSVNFLSTGGTLTVGTDGSIVFDTGDDFESLSDGQTTTARLTYTISDGFEDSTGQITIQINGADAPNVAPVAMDDSATTDEDTSVYIPILDNDTDEDVDALTIELDDPSNGSVEFDGEGYIYTPDADFNGQDSFSYTISDGEFTSTATVTVAVDPVNDAPTAADGDAETDEDTPVLLSLAGLIDDVDRDTLTVELDVPAEVGTIEFTDNGILFTPAAGISGIFDLDYTITDPSNASATGTISVTVNAVNDAPVFDAGSYAFSVAENTNAVGSVSATDPENDALTFSITGGVDRTLFAIDAATGALSFAAAPDFEAPGDEGGDNVYDLDITVSDGNLKVTTSATVTVTDVDETPDNTAPAANDDRVFTVENSTASGNVLTNDTDTDGDALRVTQATASDGTVVVIGTATDLVSGGKITLNEDGSYLFNPLTDFDSLAYDPQPEELPLFVEITYTVSDGELTDQGDLSIGIYGQNDAPELSDASTTIDEDTSINGLALAINAFDVDLGDTLSFALVKGSDHGIVEIAADGSLDFTPDANFNGTTSFVYSVTDGIATTQASFDITVLPVNDAPAFVDTGTFAVMENSTDVGVVTVQDVDNDTFVFSISGGADQALFEIDVDTGALSFRAAPDFEAPGDADGDNLYDVRVQVADQDTSVETSVEVSVTNDPADDTPVLNEVFGTEASDYVTGTNGNDLIDSRGGFLDALEGLDGADVFDFSGILGDGTQQMRRIMDYNAEQGDMLDLGDFSAASVQTVGSDTYILVGSDNDVIILQGVTGYFEETVF